MKKLISICFLLLALSTFSKDINIGDLISINVSGVNREEIAKAFENPNFQLESIKEKNDIYTIKFRPYFVGKKTLYLGKQKLNIVTKSLLTEKENKIYPNLSDLSDTKLYCTKFPYRIIFFSITGILSLMFLISNIKRTKKERNISPEEIFQNKINSLSDIDWAFELSMAIREYIDNKLGTHYVNGFYTDILPITDDDIDFLCFLDTYKFSNDDSDIKEEAILKVKNIYSKIRGENNAI